MKKFIRIGVDLAKNYFQVHALASENGLAVKRKLKRSKMCEFFSQIEPCLIGMEACGSAHFWAREIGLARDVRDSRIGAIAPIATRLIFCQRSLAKTTVNGERRFHPLSEGFRPIDRAHQA